MSIKWISENREYYDPGAIDPDEVYGLFVNEREFMIEGDRTCIYEEYFHDFRTSELPERLEFLPVEDFDDFSAVLGEFPGSVVWTDGRFECHIEQGLPRSKKTGKYDKEHKDFLIRLARVLVESQKVSKNITSVRLPRYRDAIYVTATIVCGGDEPIEQAMKKISVLWKSIAQQAQLTNQNTFEEETKWVNEAVFTKHVVIPMLKKCGLRDIRYNHGTDEYGRDITYSYFDHFGILKFGAAQVKIGNISGKAAGKLDEILGQIYDAFSMPFIDFVTKEKRYVSQLIIVVSGKYTQNAIAKIVEKTSPLLRNNVMFFDRQKINELLARGSE